MLSTLYIENRADRNQQLLERIANSPIKNKKITLWKI
nr:MAG TPA: hypothetical protein [Caudoviricetes sp.]